MFEIIIGIILLVAAVFLVVSVLFQSSKSHKMPGTIAGGAETFFGKTKGTSIDRILGKVTAIVAVVFCVLVVVMYVAQDQQDLSSLVSGNDTTAESVDHDHDHEEEAQDTTDAADTDEVVDTGDSDEADAE